MQAWKAGALGCAWLGIACSDTPPSKSPTDVEGGAGERAPEAEPDLAEPEVPPKAYKDCTDAPDGGHEIDAKTRKAKDYIAAMVRGVVSGFEREVVNDDDWVEPKEPHVLCASAPPVPADGPPRGGLYDPEEADGKDFETGTTREGWRCLRFSFSLPTHFQYGYNAHAGYKGPAVGLPDPGPNGFEAWASGDLDGDGRPSLFTITGSVDPETGMLETSKLHCADPNE